MGLFHVCIIHYKATLVFHSQPQNFSVDVGEFVTFECTFTGSLGIPTWEIDGLQYAYSAPLPPNHHVDLTGSYLTVEVVDTLINGSCYRCIINSHYSRKGILLVNVRSPPSPSNNGQFNNGHILIMMTYDLLDNCSESRITKNVSPTVSFLSQPVTSN